MNTIAILLNQTSKELNKGLWESTLSIYFENTNGSPHQDTI